MGEDTRNPDIAVSANGDSLITFGHNSDAEGCTDWILKRSMDLMDYDVELDLGAFMNGGSFEFFEIIDPNATDVDRYLYRFEAELLQN